VFGRDPFGEIGNIHASVSPLTERADAPYCIFRRRASCVWRTAPRSNAILTGPERSAGASWTIARLAGWTGYASESAPGPMTMHHGLRRFAAIVEKASLVLNTS
jgi:hypothetical protein